MQKQILSAGKRGFFSKRSSGVQVKEKFTLEDMLCFQKVVSLYLRVISAQRSYLFTDIFMIF